MFNTGSDDMSTHLDKMFNQGTRRGMNETEAALFAVGKFLEFLAHPSNLERAFQQNPEIAAMGTVNLIRWANEWLFVKNSAWSIPDTVEGLATT